MVLYFWFVFSDRPIVYLPFNVQLSKSKMPTNYVRKTNRNIRSPPDVLERVVEQVLGEGLSYRKAAENFGMDENDISATRFIKKESLTCSVEIQSTILSNQILTPAMEKDLASRIVFLADMYFACRWGSAMNW